MTKLISGSLLALSLVGAMPVMAQTPADLACVQSAVNKREGSIIAAWDIFSASARTALTTRQSSLNSAWAIQERQERRAAIKSAWQTFRTSAKDAKKTLNDSRRSAWQQFKMDAKACAGSAVKAVKDEIGSVGAENAL